MHCVSSISLWGLYTIELTKHMTQTTSKTLFLGLLSAVSAHGAIVLTESNTTVAGTNSALVSNSDLVNNGAATLSGVTSTATHASFPAANLNDGAAGASVVADSTYYVSPGNFPATVTFDLDVTTNTLGYDLTSIDTFMGWATVASEQANQIYSVEVSLVGSATFTALTNVNYTPFSGDSAGAYESRVTITDDAGVLASGVDQIRFTFSDPGGGTAAGTVVNEIDIQGTATAVPEPSSSALLSLSGLALLIRRRR